MKWARAASAVDAMVSVWLAEHLLRHGAGRGHVSGGQPRLSQIEPGELARFAALQDFFVGLFVEDGLPGAVHLLIHVHAVHHLADVVFEAGIDPFQTGASARRSIA